ncbi:hypothetical protein M231_03039 [Tremella mesenterica]|uniref:DNA helicase Pif1-like 2B domain-containing protein n=1 Tax=Tremella mesenterica TaxID=5217 RepID=A0A4Q1BP70_TREME|nr:hypothetical protein M231_03039 [Tremella mesenterica]
MNIEIAFAIAAVKYVFKYVYKGSDRSALVVHERQQSVDEITDYIEGRYISPAEARGLTADARATLCRVKSSMLEAFFLYCAAHPEETRDLLYPDAPATLTFHPESKNVQTVPRTIFIRLGPRPSKPLCSTPSLSFRSHKDGLQQLENDQEHNLCLTEAAGFKTAHTLQLLFMTIVVHSSPTNASQVLVRHQTDLYDNCAHQLRTRYGLTDPTAEDTVALGLGLLSRLAEQHGYLMTKLNLPEPPKRRHCSQRMAGDSHSLLSADSSQFEDGSNTGLTKEYLHTFQPAGFPLHVLNLKTSSPLILLCNLAPSDGLCNGTRLLVIQIGARVLQCRILGGTHDGDLVLIPRIRLLTTPEPNAPFTLFHTQFPLRLAFAMTINKAQGQSLPNASLDLAISCFGHGQLYVGLSQATNPQSTKILLLEDREGETNNVVHQEVLMAAGLRMLGPEVGQADNMVETD